MNDKKIIFLNILIKLFLMGIVITAAIHPKIMHICKESWEAGSFFTILFGSAFILVVFSEPFLKNR